MSTKKKLAIIIPIAAVLLAGIITASVIIWMAFFRRVTLPPLEDKGYATVCYELPGDGSLPTAHTGIENIGYMNWKLQHQPYWYSEMHGDVHNGAAPQKIETFKQFYDGILISADISTSSLINTAMQFCVTDDSVLWRPASVKADGYNGINTPWSDGAPSGLAISDYKLQRGLPPTDFSVYVINEKTVLKAYDVVDNGDGTYTQSFDLNPVQDPDENSSVYYYRKQMQETGNLASLPKFEYVKVKYTFDGGWQVLKMESEEKYTADKGIKATCTGTGVTEYTYGNEELAKNTAYEDYFKNYAQSFVPPVKTVTAADCLSSAFAPVVNGEANLKAELKVKDDLLSLPETFTGFVSLGGGDVQIDLGNIKARITDGEQKYLYITAGDKFKAKITLGESNGGGAGNIADKLLEQLGNGNFEISGDKRSATLTATLKLDDILGISAPQFSLKFRFELAEDLTASLVGVTASTDDLFGSRAEAKLIYTQDTANVPVDGEYVSLNISEVTQIVNSGAINAQISFADGNIAAAGTVGVNLGGNFAAHADINLASTQNPSAQRELVADYNGQTLYLKLGAEGKDPALLKASKDDMGKLMQSLIPGGQIGAGILSSLLGQVRTGDILSYVLKDKNFANCFELLADGKLVIDGDAIAKKLDPSGSFRPGKIEADLSGGVKLAAAGVTATLTAAQRQEYDLSGYTGAVDAMPAVNAVAALIYDKKLAVSGELEITSGMFNGKLEDLVISADFATGLKFGLNGTFTGGGSSKELAVRYGGQNAYAAFGGVGIEVPSQNFGEFSSAILGLYNAVAARSGGKIPQISGQAADGVQTVALGAAEVTSALNLFEIYGKNGGLAINISGAEFVITCTDGQIGLEGEYAFEGGSVRLTGGKLGKYISLGEITANCFGWAEAMPVVTALTEAVEGGGLSLRGNLMLKALGGDMDIELKNLALGLQNGIELTALAQISLEQDGQTAQKELYISYGDGARIIFDGTAIDIATDDMQGFGQAFNKLYTAISSQFGATDGTELPDTPVELPDLGSVLANLNLYKNADGNLCAGYNGATVEFTTGGDGILSLKIYGGQDSATQGELTLGGYNPADAEKPAVVNTFDGGKLIPILVETAEGIEEGGFTFAGGLNVTAKGADGAETALDISLKNLSLGFKDDFKLFGGVRFSSEGLLDKELWINYTPDGAAIALGDIRTDIPADNFPQILQDLSALYNSLSSAPIPDINIGAAQQGGLSGSINLAKLLGGLTLSKSADGDLTVNFGNGISAVITSAGEGIINVSLSAAFGDTVFKLNNCTVNKGYSAGNLPKTEVTLLPEDFTGLIGTAADIADAGGLTVNGEIALSQGNSNAVLQLANLSLGFKDGFELSADARLTIDGTSHDLYAHCGGGKLDILYGPSLAVGLDMSQTEDGTGDIATLEEALLALYNRIAAVVGKIAVNVDQNGVRTPAMQSVESLDGLLEAIGIGKDAAGDIRSLANLFGKADLKDVLQLLGSVKAGSLANTQTERGIIRLEFNGFALELYRRNQGGITVNFITGDFALQLKNISLAAGYSPSNVEMPEQKATAAEFAELLDYVGGAVELAVCDRLTVDLTGAVNTTDAEYAAQGGVKYALEGRFEYVKGTEYPVHLEITQNGDGKDYNLWVSPDMYAHAAFTMTSTLQQYDSVLFNIYIFDGDPVTADGKTSGGQTTADGGLDVYMSIGKIPQTYTGEDGAEVAAAPAKVYAPAEEILSVASAAVAMLDIGSRKVGGGIDPDLAQTLNGIMAKLGGLLDDMLVNKYLPVTKDGFAALGNSLLGSLGAEEGVAAISAQPLTTGRERLGADISFAVANDGQGGQISLDIGGASAKITKDADGRLTGLKLNNVTTNSAEGVTETLNGFDVAIGYGGFEKSYPAEGYYDLRGADTLLRAIANSATHPVADGKRAVNDGYLITGTLGLALGNLLNVDITINGLYVDTSQGGVSAEASLSYQGQPNIIMGDTDLYLSVRDGMIYIRRVQTTEFSGGLFNTNENAITPITIYRAMPLEAFTADMANQILFILNLNTNMIGSLMDSFGGSSTPQPEPRQDYGTQMAEYLRYIKVTDGDNAVWEISLNGAGINRLAGMDGLIGDGLTITLAASKQAGAEELYTLNTVGISGKLLKVFTVSGNLEWQNPCNVFKGQSGDIKDGLAGSSPAKGVEKLLGGVTGQDIKGAISWDSLEGATLNLSSMRRDRLLLPQRLKVCPWSSL